MICCILTNLKKYPFHTECAVQIQSYLKSLNHTILPIDIDLEAHNSITLKKIQEIDPDIIITLDLAGFHFHTQAGELSLNQLYCKILNLIWGNKPEYQLFLNKKLSLSMLFYDISGTDHHLQEIYSNLLYYKCVKNYPSSLPLSNSENMFSQELFAYIWKDFTKEVLLSET